MKYIDPYSICCDVYSCIMKRPVSKIYIRIGLLLCALVVPQVMAVNTSTATREAKATSVKPDIGLGEETKPLQETAGADSILDRLAAQNEELTRTLKEQAAELDQMLEQREQVEKLQIRIESDLKDLQGALKAYGRTEGFGSLLLRQRESLPDRRVYVRRARERERQFAALGVRQLDHKDEARRIADLDLAVATFEARIPADKVKQLHGSLVKLVEERQLLLGEIMAADELYLAELNKLEIAEQNLQGAAQLCDEFLAENLLWLRSAEPIRWKDLTGLPEEIRRLLDPALWLEMGRTVRREVVPSPLFWIMVAFVAMSVAKRRTILVRIQGYAERSGYTPPVRIAYTLRTMIETLAAALPWPLLLAAIGWKLRWATPTSSLSYDTGRIILSLSLDLYLLRAWYMMCIPGGMAEAHFHWPVREVRLLRRALGRLTGIYVPVVFLMRFANHLVPAEAGGTLARLVLVLWSSAFMLFFYQILNAHREWQAQGNRAHGAGFLARVYSLRYALVMIAFPLGLAVLTLTGYVYSATELAKMFVHTLGMVAVLVALYQLILCLIRIAYAAAVERQQTALKARDCEKDTAEDDPLSIDEPEIDLEALNDDTGKLVKMGAITAGLAGLYMIWHELLQALRILNEVTLGNTTLGRVVLALLAIIFTTVLARRLPAALEIVLLRFTDQPTGTRHATTTLYTYAIVTLGALFAMNAIGLRWAQFQWLVAALGVGIGFGLQEMVANFFSGLIILFERPIRVGDVVTVGDTDGVVTRIRIRATTIRNWDRKELLVPNKEFITGRLLNWTLSDQVIRVIIDVGVAYGSDTEKALALMEEAARENENVLDDPPPMVSFESFDDNALSLHLRAYLDAIDKRLLTTTDLHKAIDRKFREFGIVIAFPQRDVHLDISQPLPFSADPQEEEVK
ncbi:mechanosensitive ion channel [Pontiellaceae bacterium B12227]|nr:mechanosensitive ion channel [Pontiellaceae bacterium B12227]